MSKIKNALKNKNFYILSLISMAISTLLSFLLNEKVPDYISLTILFIGSTLFAYFIVRPIDIKDFK